MKLVHRKLRRSKSAKLSDVVRQKLHGSDYISFKQLQSAKLAQYQGQYQPELINHLLVSYGSDIDLFLERVSDDTELQKNICSTQVDLMGQVVWAIEKEQALTLDDVIFGRTSLGLFGIQAHELLGVVELMAQHLNWNQDEQARQLAVTSARLDKTQAAIHG